ncbi:MAG: hypothetical protein AAF602_24070 [Myxococcota bacterium]
MALRPPLESAPDAVDVTWHHDGMTVRQAGTIRPKLLITAILWGVIGVNVLDGVSGPGSAIRVDLLLAAVYATLLPVWLVSVLPRRIEVRGDWLTLVGVGRSRVRLDAIDAIRLDRQGAMVFTLRSGGRRTLWLRPVLADVGRQWLLEQLREAVARARAREATREPLDEASRSALAALQHDASTQR